MANDSSGFHCLIIDWGGVLTEPTGGPVGRWLSKQGVDREVFHAVLSEWGDDVDPTALPTPLQLIERGQITIEEFEVLISLELTRRTGIDYPQQGLFDGMWLSLEHDYAMQDLVRQMRQSGVRVVLLSNSWGNPYKRESWSELFDEVIVSGEVGMRKPDIEIYGLALERAGHPAEACVFLDDMLVNIEKARSLGITSVHHRDFVSTEPEIKRLFSPYFRQ